MKQKYGLPFIAAAALALLFYLGLSWVKKSEIEFKYKVTSEQQIFYTNSFTKSTDGCIQFLDRRENLVTVCGNYTISKTTN